MPRLGWIALSGVAHGALAYALSTLEWDDPPLPSNAAIEVAIFEAKPVAREPPPLENTEAPAPAERPRRTGSAPPRPDPEPALSPEPAPSIEPAPSPEPAPSAAPFVLPSARDVALSTFALEPGVIDAGVVEAAKGPLRDADERALENAVMAAARRVDTVPDPVLRPLSGGGYSYRGNGFVASIENDGSVHMADNFRDAKFIFRPSAGEDGLAAGFKFFTTKFDIFKRIDRALGNDPFQSERRWFLDRTRPLREALAARYLEQRVHSRRDE